jgi:hypothetical protein
MHICAPARQPPTWIGNEIILDDDDAQQIDMLASAIRG